MNVHGICSDEMHCPSKPLLNNRAQKMKIEIGWNDAVSLHNLIIPSECCVWPISAGPME